MLYIVTKVFADSDLNSGLQDIEDDFEDGNTSFEINHPEFRISVDTSEREII